MVLCNCNYNKVKALHGISELVTFLDKHAIKDGNNDGHPLCSDEFRELKNDLERHAEKLRTAIEGLSREGKFG